VVREGSPKRRRMILEKLWRMDTGGARADRIGKACGLDTGLRARGSNS